MDERTWTEDEIRAAGRMANKNSFTGERVRMRDLLDALTKPPERKLLPDRPMMYNWNGGTYVTTEIGGATGINATNIRALFTEDEVMDALATALDDAEVLRYLSEEIQDALRGRLDAIKYGEES